MLHKTPEIVVERPYEVTDLRIIAIQESGEKLFKYLKDIKDQRMSRKNDMHWFMNCAKLHTRLEIIHYYGCDFPDLENQRADALKYLVRDKDVISDIHIWKKVCGRLVKLPPTLREDLLDFREKANAFIRKYT